LICLAASAANVRNAKNPNTHASAKRGRQFPRREWFCSNSDILKVCDDQATRSIVEFPTKTGVFHSDQ
jgi:hypothetical protein